MDRKGLTELIGKVQGCGRRAINETETVVVQNEQIADYLIANGIGDISSEKHRADVMEWALRKRCKSPCDSGYYCTLDEDLRAECVGKYDYKNCYKYHIRQAERVERIRNYSRPAIVAICR